MIIVNARFLTQEITGVQRFAVEISKKLKMYYKNNIHFISPANIIHIDLAEELQAEKIGFFSGHIWEQIDVPLYLKKNNSPLLLNLANTAPILYGNKISTIHDIAFIRYPYSFSDNFVWLYNFLVPKIIYSSKKILTVSDFSKNEINQFYKINLDEIEVIYNACSDDFKFEMDEDLKLENYFLVVSSLNKRKNFNLILEAFNIISKSNKIIKLYIIGDVVTKNFSEFKLKEEYLKNPQIVFLGRVSDQDIIKYYSNAKAFLFPSLYEGFGIPPLEAQSCLCPVIVSNTSCLPEIFQDSVLYCDPLSVESLSKQMNVIMSNDSLRAKLVMEGKDNSKRFSWKKSVEKLIKIIDLCLLQK